MVPSGTAMFEYDVMVSITEHPPENIRIIA